MVGWIMTPLNAYILIPQTCEYVTLRNKTYFEGEIKLRILSEDIIWIIQINTL